MPGFNLAALLTLGCSIGCAWLDDWIAAYGLLVLAVLVRDLGRAEASRGSKITGRIFPGR